MSMSNLRKTITTAPVFGERGTLCFEGSRKELYTFLKEKEPELYNSVFYKTVNGETSDWFWSISADLLKSWLRAVGFNWKETTKIIICKDRRAIKS